MKGLLKRVAFLFKLARILLSKEAETTIECKNSMLCVVKLEITFSIGKIHTMLLTSVSRY